MKNIPKKLFDEFVSISREFWKTSDNDLIKKRIEMSQQICKETGIDWSAILDFIDSIIRYTGFLPGADNETLYALLHLMGWGVADEIEEGESL